MNDNVTLEMARTTIIALATFLRQALPTLSALDLAPDTTQPLAVQLEQAFNGLVLKTCQLAEDARAAEAQRESLHALKQRIRYVENAQRDPATLLDDVAWLLNDSGIFRGLATACVVRPGDDPGLDLPTLCLLDPATREPLVERGDEDEDNLLKLQLDRLRDLLDEDARRRIAAAEDAATTATGAVKLAQDHARSLSVELERQIKENEALSERLKVARANGQAAHDALCLAEKGWAEAQDMLEKVRDELKNERNQNAYLVKEIESSNADIDRLGARVEQLEDELIKKDNAYKATLEQYEENKKSLQTARALCDDEAAKKMRALNQSDLDRVTVENLKAEVQRLRAENDLLREGAESAGKMSESALNMLNAVADGPVDRYGHALNASLVHKQIGGLLLAFAAAEDLHAQQIYRLAQHTGDERWREMEPDKMINLAVDCATRAKVLADRSNDKALATGEIKRRLADAANYIAFAWARWSTLRGE